MDNKEKLNEFLKSTIITGMIREDYEIFIEQILIYGNIRIPIIIGGNISPVLLIDIEGVSKFINDFKVSKYVNDYKIFNISSFLETNIITETLNYLENEKIKKEKNIETDTAGEIWKNFNSFLNETRFSNVNDFNPTTNRMYQDSKLMLDNFRINLTKLNLKPKFNLKKEFKKLYKKIEDFITRWYIIFSSYFKFRKISKQHKFTKKEYKFYKNLFCNKARIRELDKILQTANYFSDKPVYQSE